MATQAAIRQRIYDYLYSSFPTSAPFVSRLGASYSSGATSITVSSDTQWEIGDVLENTLTGEQFKVIAKPGSNVLTVIPGWNGTTQAASSGSTDPIYKNPRFTRKQVDDSVTAVLAQLEHWGIHTFNTGSITRADPAYVYTVSETDIIPSIGILALYIKRTNSLLPEYLPYQYSQQHATALWSGGDFLTVGHFGDSNDGATIYYTYAQKIDAVTDLLTRQEELVVVGAVASLLGGTIVPATHDPGARTDRTVSPGQTSRDVRHFQSLFITYARTEAGLLSVERQRMGREPTQYRRMRRWIS